jgi:hypothetical protein
MRVRPYAEIIEWGKGQLHQNRVRWRKIALSNPDSARPEVEKLFLTFSPCPLCEALGSAFFPWPLGLALFHLSSFIFVRSDDADRFLKLASAAVVRCQPLFQVVTHIFSTAAARWVDPARRFALRSYVLTD